MGSLWRSAGILNTPVVERASNTFRLAATRLTCHPESCLPMRLHRPAPPARPTCPPPPARPTGPPHRPSYRTPACRYHPHQHGSVGTQTPTASGPLIIPESWLPNGLSDLYEPAGGCEIAEFHRLMQVGAGGSGSGSGSMRACACMSVLKSTRKTLRKDSLCDAVHECVCVCVCAWY